MVQKANQLCYPINLSGGKAAAVIPAKSLCLTLKSSYCRLATVRSFIISEAKRDKLHKRMG